ncbi:MAG: 2-C-methyl-D-erythritol 2,4-cyclodiphosphate synthase [Alphaproteobacteria bacterium]|nr:2-C-methyl-D-erythritol 2,4-cyclodiphosphate synthase [Alphaproteobacteria bacterium]
MTDNSDNRRAALILAAGSGQRFDATGANKVYAQLPDGRTLLRAALETCRAAPALARADIRAVIAAGDKDAYASAVAGLAIGAPVIGGATRSESVRNGLEILASDPPDEILLHDAARPFASPDLTERLFAALAEDKNIAGVFPTRPLHDAVHELNDAGVLLRSLRRDTLARAQTPQVFRFAPLLKAHRAAASATDDDAGLVAAAGGNVKAIPGEADNVKVTTSDDLRFVSFADNLRVGSGFDMHRFADATDDSAVIRLGGVEFASRRALLGHSDGDVILHALSDAIYGALADADIGAHFPSADPRWRGADSRHFLRDACERLRARGGRLINADVTFIGAEPRLSERRDEVRASLASVLGVGAERVSCKATTTDGIGALGRGEGVAASAQVLVALGGLRGQTGD